MLTLFLNRAYKKALIERLDGSVPDIPVPDGGRSEEIFTRAMFALMGRVAKLDGRVSEAEVTFASNIMKLMDLFREKRERAISHYEQGKRANSDVLQQVQLMTKVIGQRSELARLFLQIQCRHVYIKGDMGLQEKMLLRNVADVLGYSKSEFLSACSDMQGDAERKQVKLHKFLGNAYRVLQLEPEVDDGEIRRAYLRLMSRYHPDKLVRDELSAESLKQAQEKSMAIRSAYETVCGFRKLRV